MTRKTPHPKPSSKPHTVKPSSPDAPPPPRKRRLWPVVRFGLTLLVWLVILTGALGVYYALDLPDIRQAMETTRRPGITVVARDGTTIATYGQLYGQPVQVEDLPPALPQAVMATEDRRFMDHWGLDPWSILRAMWVNVRAGRIVQGGSTITQQVAKNLFLTSDRTLKRKIQELMLSVWLEATFSKNQIMTMYLNRVYLGAGTYGVDAAARRYFGKRATELNLYQSALIAGLLKAPSKYNPSADPELSQRRTQQVLINMVAAGYLTDAQAKAAKPPKWTPVSASGRSVGRYFTDWIMEQLDSYVGGIGNDLVVTTTLDLTLQRAAERTLADSLNGPGVKRKVTQGAVVVLGHDGAVQAMVGGKSYNASQFNRATQAMRQPGSAFKPFVYLTAIEMGLPDDQQFFDEKVTIDGWTPRNFSDTYAGPMTVREAFAKSVNTVAVQVQEMAGRDRVIELARSLGIVTPLTEHPSLALGTSEITPLDLAAAYAPLANGGNVVVPHGILSVRDRDGKILYNRQAGGLGRVLEPDSVRTIQSLMTEVVENGTGKAAKLNGIPAAGKTGTSQDFRDAWFAGYTGRYVGVVWMGNDDFSATKGVTGGSLPARVWKQVIQSGYKRP